MNAFVTPFTITPRTPRSSTLCSTRPATPYLASAAFGAPIPQRANLFTASATTRMDVTVVVGENEPVESALRRFKKDVSKSGHLFELRRRRYFETNTEKRIRKAAAARRKAKIARNETRKNSSRSGGSAKPRSTLLKTAASAST